jgi:tetratricopeptide (TPR) repeat protein
MEIFLPPTEEEPAAGSLAAAIPAPDAVAPLPEIPLPLDEEEPAPALPAAESAEPLDEMPEELRALMDEAATEGQIEILAAGGSDEPFMVDDLAEAEFYLGQGMLEEAQGVYERMRVRHPEHPTVAQLGQRLRQAVTRPPDAVSQIPTATVEEIEASVRSVAPPAAPKPAAAAAPAEPSLEGVTPKFSVTDTAAPPSGGFVDLGAELEEEMAAVEQQGGAHAGTTPLVDGLIREFQKGVREQLDEKDFETHYNLGIAYKEMELYDEAIQEFQLTARDPARLLECADLMGLCYLAKGQPDQAVRSLSAGLEVEGHPPASYHSLHYDLGVAYEALGELQKSLAQFELLQQQGAQFRDVQVRVQGLRARLPKATGAAPPDGPKTPRKKKISFI